MDLRAGQNHDQGGRLNHRYQYPDHELRSEGMDWRFMQKYKVLVWIRKYFTCTVQYLTLLSILTATLT